MIKATLYTRILFAFVVTVLTFGIFAPALISAANTWAVAFGFVLLFVVWPAFMHWLLKDSWREVLDRIKANKTALVLVVLCGLVGGCEKVPAGYKGVKVYLLGGAKGVEAEEKGVGRCWIGWNEELYLFPVFTQNYVWTKDKDEGSPNDESITFQTMEGLTVNGDFGISYSVKPDKVSEIFQKYRKGIEEITDVFLRNMVRDALNAEASTKPVEYVYGQGKAELMTAVEERVRTQVSNYLNIDRIYLIGSLRLPQAVIQALNDKISAKQRAEQRENELREAEAEAKKVAAAAKGQADAILLQANAQAKANEVLSKSITPTLVQYETVKRWDGVMPRFVGGEGGIPLLTIGDETEKK